MTYCTGSSSRDLFNYWGEEGWGLQVPTERGGASAAQPAWRAGRRAEAQARPTAPALGGTICVGLCTPLPRRWGVDEVLHSCGISDPAGWQPAPRS